MDTARAIAPAVRWFIGLSAAAACAWIAPSASALDSDGEPVLLNRRNAEVLTRAAALGISGITDTIYVGFTPGHSADNWWSIWASRSGHRPPAQNAMWGFEPPYADVHSDSLQGWWSIR
jgi:hypothetical protein